ncbi:hypothetical protein D3C87_2034260 [compost metagenome]
MPTKVDVKMIEPPPDLSIDGICNFVPRNADVRLPAITLFQSSKLASVNGPIGPTVPALLKAISRRPNSL